MKIGNLDISAFKVGTSDCAIYLGTIKLYPSDEPTPTFDGKWKLTLSDGSTVSAECDSTSAITSTETQQYKAATVSAVIGDCVTSVGDLAFSQASGLTSVTIGSNVASIGNQGFYNCVSLASITIPNSVVTIASNVFYQCKLLTSLTIPNSVTSIGVYTFARCSGLTNITVEATTPPSIGSGAFDDTNNCPIYVPCESYGDYYVSWTAYADRIALENGQIVWTETTDTICQLGEIYAIETLEKWSCDGGTTWYTPTQTITRIGRDLGESCSASHVFDASEVYNSGISHIEYGTPYVSPSGFEFIVEGVQCVVNTNAVNMNTRNNPYPVIFTTTNSDAIHDITFVTTNSVGLFGFTTNIDNNTDYETNINDDYTNTSGSCTVDGTTRYWKRFEVMEGHTPFTSVRLKRTSTAINLMFAGINTDSDWVNNLPSS